ncbi:MAG: winged helix DNA-binding protein [Fimbriimonadaceae bacterium]
MARNASEEKLLFSQLSEQVAQMAEKISQLRALTESDDLASTAVADKAVDSERREFTSRVQPRFSRPVLPDSRLVRKIIRQRQLRGRFLDPSLFGDPAWDMLLDLTAATVEHLRVSVTSLCIASGVPATTALRWISLLIEAGLLARNEDETDRRRAFVVLTDKGIDAMARFFSQLGNDARLLV